MENNPQSDLSDGRSLANRVESNTNLYDFATSCQQSIAGYR